MFKELFATCALLMPLGIQAQQKSAWESLPEDTVAAMRLDLSENISSQIQDNTRLGRQVFSPTRIQQMKDIIIKNIPEKALLEMSQDGFEPKDIFDIFSSKFGVAAVHNKINDEDAILVLMWSDMEAALLNKIYTQIEEKSGEKNVRVDIQLDGQKVIHLSKANDDDQVMITRIGNRLIVAVQAASLEGKANRAFDTINEGGFDKRSFEPKHHQKEATDGIVSGHQNEFVEGEDEAEALSPEEQKNLKILKPLLEENAKKYLTRFLMAQKGEGSSFADAVAAKPGLIKARPQGDSIIEAYVDIEKLISFVPEKDKAKFEMTGLHTAKAAGMWMSLQGNNIVSSLFLSAPRERKVFLSLVDQPLFPSQPASWVPASVNNYSHMSFDFVRLYNVVKDFAGALVGPVVAQQEERINMQLQMFAGVDLNTLLSSFGKQITALDYGMILAGANGGAKKQVMPRQSYLLPFSNEAVINKVFALITAFGANSGIKKENILGFDGFNLPSPEMPVSIFYGKKHLILSIGPDATEKTLSALSKPGEGEELLVNSPKFKEFFAQENPSASMMFAYGDAGNTATMLSDIFSQAITEDMISEMDEKGRKIFLEMKKVMPSKKDLEGIFGISSSIAIPSDEGVIMKSKISLP